MKHGISLGRLRDMLDDIDECVKEIDDFFHDEGKSEKEKYIYAKAKLETMFRFVCTALENESDL